MIDLNWIASQPKPVAIHCPTYHDIMTVLCDVNERRYDPLDTEAIITVVNAWWARFGDQTCVRISVKDDDKCEVWRNSYAFYELSSKYILVSINEVKSTIADLGEIEIGSSDLSTLFGEEGVHG